MRNGVLVLIGVFMFVFSVYSIAGSIKTVKQEKELSETKKSLIALNKMTPEEYYSVTRQNFADRIEFLDRSIKAAKLR